jgi:hypothetical protein
MNSNKRKKEVKAKKANLFFFQKTRLPKIETRIIGE